MGNFASPQQQNPLAGILQALLGGGGGAPFAQPTQVGAPQFRPSVTPTVTGPSGPAPGSPELFQQLFGELAPFFQALNGLDAARDAVAYGNAAGGFFGDVGQPDWLTNVQGFLGKARDRGQFRTIQQAARNQLLAPFGSNAPQHILDLNQQLSGLQFGGVPGFGTPRTGGPQQRQPAATFVGQPPPEQRAILSDPLRLPTTPFGVL